MSKNHSWKTSVDYWDKLNNEEKEFLRVFNREWGLGYFDKGTAALEYYKRDRWNERNAERRDAMNRGAESIDEMREIELRGND